MKQTWMDMTTQARSIPDNDYVILRVLRQSSKVAVVSILSFYGTIGQLALP